MKSAFIISLLLTSTFAQQYSSIEQEFFDAGVGAYTGGSSDFDNYSPSSNSLSKLDAEGDNLAFDVIPLLAKAAKALAPPVIDEAIKFLRNRQAGIKESNNQRENGNSKNLKKHATIMSWLTTMSPTLIEGAIKALELAKSQLNTNSLDGETDGNMLIVSNFEQLNFIDPNTLKNIIEANESSGSTDFDGFY